VLRIAGESPYTRLPVYSGTLDHMVGYLHVQDIARQALDANERMPLRPLLFLPGGLSLERVLTRLREERQHVALITDEFGGTAGLVTVGDILDELLGGVADEFKAEEWIPEPLPDGRVRLPGSLRLTAAARHLGVHWEGESATLGGFVMERLGHVPQVGEQVVLGHIRLEVETMAGRRVASVLADSAVAAEVERG
jgi:putative hemolysin